MMLSIFTNGKLSDHLFNVIIFLQGVNEVTVDKSNQVYSTPAFMYGIAQYHEIDDGIGNMVKCVIDALKKQ